MSVPNLDQREAVVRRSWSTRVTNGKGVMPSFTGKFSEKQIEDVAKYVSSVAGK